MFNLALNESIQFYCVNASSLTITCEGLVTDSAGKQNPESLGGFFVSNGSWQEVYKVETPNLKALCAVVLITNTSGSDQSFSLCRVPDGGSPSESNAIEWAFQLLAGQSYAFNRGNKTVLPVEEAVVKTSHPTLTDLGWTTAGHTIDTDIDMASNKLLNLVDQSAECDENISAGMAVYVKKTSTAGHFAKAFAEGTDSALCNIIGLCKADATSGNPAKVVNNTNLTLATWTAVLVGGSATLTVGNTYYVAYGTSEEGLLTDTPPSTVGQYLIPIGKAITTTTMSIEIGHIIAL
jgi:hypothetical protein